MGFPGHWPRPIRSAPNIDLERAAEKYALTHSVVNKNLWRPLHEFAKQPHTIQEQQEYVKQWEASLPESCGCLEKWIALDFKFNYGPDFLQSTVEAHDVVAKQLYGQGKQQHLSTLDEAMQVWLGPRVGFFAISHMNIGGAETWAETLLPTLRHYVNIVGFACFDKTLERGNPTKVKVPYYYDPEILIKQCDILVAWGVPSIVQYGKPVVSINHTDLNSGWSSDLLAFGDVQVAVNPACKGVYIPNVIDPKRAAVHRAPIKNTVLWGHRLSEEKQPLKLLEIAKLMPDYQFTMVGDGILFDECKLNAPFNVKMVGAKENLVNELTTAECFISLSKFEGFGLSVGEAMLSKVPVVSTPTGICTSKVATLVESEDSPAVWANAIRARENKIQEAYSFAKTFNLKRSVFAWTSLLLDLWDSQK